MYIGKAVVHMIRKQIEGEGARLPSCHPEVAYSGVLVN